MIHNSFNRYYSDEKLNSQVRKKNQQKNKQTNKQTKQYKTKKQRQNQPFCTFGLFAGTGTDMATMHPLCLRSHKKGICK